MILAGNTPVKPIGLDMKIREILKRKQTLSFEFFPPKSEEGIDNLFETISRLNRYNPDFIDFTYGAGGATQHLTMELCVRAHRNTSMNIMAHVTCVAQTKEHIHRLLRELESEGIENVILLRGDRPTGENGPQATDHGYRHSTDLIDHAKRNFNFGIAAACYPEIHPESPNLATDLYYTKLKIERGADFLITQLFYNNDDYYKFVDEASRAGINVPIIPGLMPILNTIQINRITDLCGASIPSDLKKQLEKHADNERSVQEIGIEHTMQQVQGLISNNVPGIHFYVLNRSYSISRILDGLSGHPIITRSDNRPA